MVQVGQGGEGRGGSLYLAKNGSTRVYYHEGDEGGRSIYLLDSRVGSYELSLFKEEQLFEYTFPFRPCFVLESVMFVVFMFVSLSVFSLTLTLAWFALDQRHRDASEEN